MEKTQKTRDEVLNQDYITPQDLKIIMPTLGINNCIEIIREIRNDMKEQNLFVPNSKPLLALTRVAKKKLGLR